MSQITLRELPEVLDHQLRSLAKKNHTSLNRTIQNILMETLGLSEGSSRKRDLSDLSGAWSREEAEAFEKDLAVFDQIDDEIWS